MVPGLVQDTTTGRKSDQWLPSRGGQSTAAAEGPVFERQPHVRHTADKHRTSSESQVCMCVHFHQLWALRVSVMRDMHVLRCCCIFHSHIQLHNNGLTGTVPDTISGLLLLQYVLKRLPVVVPSLAHSRLCSCTYLQTAVSVRQQVQWKHS